MEVLFSSTHVLDVAEKLCNKISIIKNGKLIASGNTGDVKGDESFGGIFHGGDRTMSNIWILLKAQLINFFPY